MINNDSSEKIDELSDILQVEGVKAKGYGIIPKIVMQDPRLTISAKAIYAYMCSFAGSGTTAFPCVEKICKDLGIKDYNTFKKHRNLLEKYGYIRVEQNRKNGFFDKNVYTIIDKPAPVETVSDDDEIENLFFKVVGRRKDGFIRILKSKFDRKDIINKIRFLEEYKKTHEVKSPEGFIFEALKNGYEPNEDFNKIDMVVCTKCDGLGYIFDPDKNIAYQCYTCQGKGKISAEAEKA